jgi:hypothetical protein
MDVTRALGEALSFVGEVTANFLVIKQSNSLFDTRNHEG